MKNTLTSNEFLLLHIAVKFNFFFFQFISCEYLFYENV